MPQGPQGLQQDTRKLNTLKIERRAPDGGAHTANNEPQALLYSTTKVSANETELKETSGEPHAMARTARRAAYKNKAPKTTEE